MEIGTSWTHLVEVTGEQGAAWVASYRPYASIAERSHESVLMLRRHEVLASRALLHEILIDLHRVNGVYPSVRHVLSRWYKAAAAYSSYYDSRLDEALDLLLGAQADIESAITLHRFLLPLSFQCIDFTQQRARIARRRRDWEGLARCLQLLEAMYVDKAPLCNTADGQAIYISSLWEHYEALAIEEKDKKALSILADEPYRVSMYQDAVLSICTQTDLVIPYI